MRAKDILGIFNIIIVLAILGGISYLAFALRPADYDPRTLCLTGETPPHIAIVIDKTDLYSNAQRNDIEAIVLDRRNTLGIGEKLSLHELDASGALVNTNNFELCNPGRGDQINPLYRNAQRIEARYQAFFEGPLKASLDDLVEPKESPRSPIIEAIARLSTQGDFGADVPARRIVLVSDMLQNSALFTVYGRNRANLPQSLPEPAQAAAQIEQAFGDGLAGVTIEIYLIPRRGWEGAQDGPLQSYWNEVFRELGMRVRWSAI